MSDHDDAVELTEGTAPGGHPSVTARCRHGGRQVVSLEDDHPASRPPYLQLSVLYGLVMECGCRCAEELIRELGGGPDVVDHILEVREANRRRARQCAVVPEPPEPDPAA